MTSKIPGTLKFHSYTFTPLKTGGQIWLTSSELAKAFGLSTTKALLACYERNQDEFTAEMTYMSDATSRQSSGKLYRKKTRVFSLWGAHILSIFINTSSSNKFRIWVLEQITGSETEVSVLVKRQFTDDELCSLCWLLKIARHLKEGIELIYPILRTLESTYAGNFYSMSYEYNHSLRNAKKLLARETQHISPHPHKIADSNWRRVLPDIRDD